MKLLRIKLFTVFFILFIISCTGDKNPFGLKSNFDDEDFIDLQENPPTKGYVTLQVGEGFIFPLAVKVIFSSLDNCVGVNEEWPDVYIEPEDSYIFSCLYNIEFHNTGFHNLGNISLNSVTTISNKSFSTLTNWIYYDYSEDKYVTNIVETPYYLPSERIIADCTYAIVTKGGHYAKIKVLEYNGNSVTFDWGYQPNGTRQFDE